MTNPGIQISRLVLTIIESSWKIEIQFNPCTFRQSLSPITRWLSSIDPPRYTPIKREESSSIMYVNFLAEIFSTWHHLHFSVKHRPHSLSVFLDHHSPAYLQENYSIIIQITNTDDREFSVVVDVLLPPTEIDGMGKGFLHSPTK